MDKPRNLSLVRRRWGIEIEGVEQLPAGTPVLVRTASGREWPAQLGEVAHVLPASIVYHRIDAARDSALAAIRAWNLLCQDPTTRQVADYCGWSIFRAADELDRLRRRDEVWSVVVSLPGGLARRWRIVNPEARCA